MGETIMLVIVLLLSLYGCVELIRCITFLILKPFGQHSGILVLPISGHCTDVEYLVRTATTRNRWTADLTGYVLLLDEGMDEETRTLAEGICAQCDNVRLGRPEEFEKIIANGLQ